MNLKKLTVVAGALAFAGYASAATVLDTDGDDSVSDVDITKSLVSNGSGTGAPATPFTFDASILGECACLEIDLTGQDLGAGSIHTLGAQLSVTLTNNMSKPWINVELNIQPQCGTDSPDTDGLSFDQGNPGRSILANVPHTYTVDELAHRDFIRYDFTAGAIGVGESVTLTFPVASGANAPEIDPFYIKIVPNVPEPSSIALMGLGFIGFFTRRRR